MKFLHQAYHWILAVSAYWFYGRPARKLKVIGITGTKGKSTTSRLVASVLEAGGYKVGLLSTVEFQIGNIRVPNDKKMTMLGRGQVQKMIRAMVKAGCEYAVIETSSEGILQYRHYGLHYDVCVFTNLGTEHSERHGGFENLRRDKAKIFAGLKSEPVKIIAGRQVEKAIVVNSDDANAGYFLNFPAVTKVTFALRDSRADYHGQIETENSDGVNFKLGDRLVHINLAGEFNVYNALAAIAVGRTQGISLEQAVDGLSSVKEVAGRMEYIRAGQPFDVVVDYAHEPLSLTSLFESLRKNISAEKRIIAVIGSDGGGRDVGKRGRMGEVAGMLCDVVLITDVNCFDEDPAKIAEMLAAGARLAGKKDGINLFVEIDRHKAITNAISLAMPGDVVAVTAKGTEPCIVVAGGKKIPWDDRAVVRQILSEMKYPQ